MKTVAILGATGFVGTRLVEMFHLAGRPVRPIAARPASRAALARFALDWRLANAADPASLAPALAGCDCVIHLATGNPSTILELSAPVYAAAARAGVRRLVFASSAAVHGQAPAPGTTEATPLPRRHDFPYNAAKAAAEERLRAARADGPVELVILRPGIVWGPRSRWVLEVVRAVQDGSFGWRQGGRGLINAIYVDNFVHALDAAGAAPVDGRTFLVNDPAPTTWREFFTPWIEAGGLTPEAVPEAPPTAPARGWRVALERTRVHAWTQRAARHVPGRVKRTLKAALLAGPPTGAEAPLAGYHAGPRPPAPLSEEMTLLQSCAWRFPTIAAETALGWQPRVPWPEAVARTLGWLRFAGWLPDPAAVSPATP